MKKLVLFIAKHSVELLFSIAVIGLSASLHHLVAVAIPSSVLVHLVPKLLKKLLEVIG